MTEELIDDGIDNYAESDNFSAAEKIALRWSELMDEAPDEIDADFYDQLKGHYTTAQIVELGSYIAFNIGYHRFFGTLDFYPMFDPHGNLVSQEESREIYGDKPKSHTLGARDRAADRAAGEAAE